MTSAASSPDGGGRVLPVNELPRSGPPSADLPTPPTVLAIGAHPDDIEFGCGATLAKWSAAGSEVWHLVLTDGSKGTWDPRQRRSDLVETRRREAERAAERLGSKGVLFGEWRDGELRAGSRQQWVVSRTLRRLRPAVVLGHDPWRRYRLHPDHQVAGLLLTGGVVAARDPHFFPDQALAPHRPETVLLWEADEVNHVENAAGFDSAKVSALLAHRSQYPSTMGITGVDEEVGIDHPAAAGFRRRLETQLAEQGALTGATSGEAFHRIDEL